MAKIIQLSIDEKVYDDLSFALTDKTVEEYLSDQISQLIDEYEIDVSETAKSNKRRELKKEIDKKRAYLHYLRDKSKWCYLDKEEFNDLYSLEDEIIELEDRLNELEDDNDENNENDNS